MFASTGSLALAQGVVRLYRLAGARPRSYFEDPDDGERPQTNWNVVAQEKIARLNTGQRQILDEVSAAIDLGQYAANRLFFVTGAGGTGKTCLFNTMIAKVKSDGKVVLMSGDFKQLAPVAKGEGMDGQIMASIRHSELFVYFKHLKLTENMRARNEVDFIKWLTAVGNGENILEDPLEKIDDLKGSMILCTKNDTVFTINDMLLDKIPNEERVFKSIDTPILDPEGAAAALLDVHAEDYNVESINKLTPTGLPPHHLRLKVGADGLCNGTMLQITEIHSDIIKCRRLEEDDRFDQVVYLPRIKFEYGTGENDRTVKFRRIQFPIRLAFANTINKAQGQTLQRLGLYLYGQEAFSHGQIYTALSRVRTMSSIRVLKLGLPMPSYLLNVVYYELLLPK
ncbi:hypothetical protein QR680_008850 [Steinernema hermaphroditum]|uniref:ATP-dependent DNA helicase n=1 Tax=Steinernema hermaphroditum TaxID=289476 RepID=A0AA39II61_9BILA|nr:hypothetical protein QR680_008850 [Steinernema hermaphroditum]